MVHVDYEDCEDIDAKVVIIILLYYGEVVNGSMYKPGVNLRTVSKYRT